MCQVWPHPRLPFESRFLRRAEEHYPEFWSYNLAGMIMCEG